MINEINETFSKTVEDLSVRQIKQEVAFKRLLATWNGWIFRYRNAPKFYRPTYVVLSHLGYCLYQTSAAIFCYFTRELLFDNIK